MTTRETIRTVIISSGYFNPVHVGHLNYLRAAKEMANSFGTHICIVNNDEQVKLKGSVPFQSQEERLDIVNELRCVDLAVLSIDDDLSVAKSIERICKGIEDEYQGMPVEVYFVNGGDRDSKNSQTAENDVCQKYNIICLYGIGGQEKDNSSSEIIRKSHESIINK